MTRTLPRFLTGAALFAAPLSLCLLATSLAAQDPTKPLPKDTAKATPKPAPGDTTNS